MKPVWCVRHNDGTCATLNGKRPRDNAMNVKTLCDHFVVLHGGGVKEVPTCEECRAILEGRKKTGIAGE